MLTCWCDCTTRSGVAPVVAVVMKLLVIACASCKALNRQVFYLMRLAAFEMKTEIASFHSSVDTA